MVIGPEKLKNSLSVPGLSFVGEHTFECGNKAPIYEVTTMHGLNQVIGYAKFINKGYGEVFYRGENHLHNGLIPSLFRGCVGTTKWNIVSPLVNKIIKDDGVKDAINVGTSVTLGRMKVEGMLQHYGVQTRYTDLVDNHWVALWMGLYKCEVNKRIVKYHHYSKRKNECLDVYDGTTHPKDDLYQYILLLAIPKPTTIIEGVELSDDFVLVDLRQSLPSVFLRPHSQHGLVVRKKPDVNKYAKEYDMASEVIGILKIRIDKADQWLGNGQLLSQENLFPSPMNDYGYDLLLNLPAEFFPEGYNIARYV